MKNSKLLILALFISLTAMAQVKTGGGPDIDGLYTEDMVMTDASMLNLIKELKANDVKCSATPRLTDVNIVQIYVKLTLLENMEKSNQQCAEANKYLACLHTRHTSKLAKKVLETPSSVSYLSEQLNIEHAETLKILNYFVKPKKKK